MPNRRTFFATAASGWAWLMGARPTKPLPELPRALDKGKGGSWTAESFCVVSSGTCSLTSLTFIGPDGKRTTIYPKQ